MCMNLPNWLEPRIEYKRPRPNEPLVNRGIKDIAPNRPCDDCGLSLERTRIVETRRLQKPEPRTQRQCKHCGLYEHPDEPGSFTLNNNELRAIIKRNFLAKDK